MDQAARLCRPVAAHLLLQLSGAAAGAVPGFVVERGDTALRGGQP